MSNTKKVPLKPTTASRIPTTGRDSGTHSRSSSISNLTSVSDTKSDIGDTVSLETNAPEFKIGDRVWVNGTKPGVLKFLGKTQFALGAWAGVVLDEPAGKNDGSVDGVRYFQCESKKGIFARPHKLTRVAGSPPSIGDSPSVGAVSRPQTPEVSSRPLTLANVSSVTPKVCSGLRLGERVYVNSTTGVKSGILRYIGVTDFAKGDWAGIELDQPLGKNDGSVANKRYFTCKAKHGLFSPLHKVSHAGGTPRTPSALGSRMRSDSRESLNSSISSCSTSRSNRVKLGVTSLTNTQKMLRGPGAGIMTNSRALEETIKEKEQHIEELLKERELERTEVARATNQYLEAERKLLEFKEIEGKQSQFKNLFEKAEIERKKLEGQTFDDKRKLEDLQFQLEEEAIAKGDLEIQLQQKHYVLQKLEDFANRELGENSYRVKEILKGQEYQGGDIEHFSPSETEINSQKISQLEADLQSTKNEKLDLSKVIEEIQEKLSNYELAKEEKELLVSTLNSNLQEKDLFIHKLKDELNSSEVKIDNLAKEIENLNAESAQQKAQVKEKNDFIQDSKEKYLKEIEDVREQLSISSAATAEKQLVVSSLNKEVQDKDLSIQKMKDGFVSFEEKVAHLSQQIEDLNIEAEKQKVNSEKVLNDAMENLKKQIADSEMKDGTITDIKEQLSSVIEQLSRKANDFIQLECELNDFKSKNQSLLEAKGDRESALQEQLNNSLEKFESLTSMNQQQIEDVKQRDIKIADFERQLSAVKDQLHEKECIFIKTEAELNDFKFKYQSLVKDKEDSDISMHEQLEKNLEKVESLMRANQTQIEESQRKDTIILDFEGQLSSVKDQLNNKNEELSKLDSELNQLQSQHQSLSREKEENEKRMHQQLKDAFEKFDSLTSSKQQEVDTLQEEIRIISESGKKQDKLLSEKDSEKMELEAAVEGKEKTIAELSQKLKQTEDELQNVTITFSERVNLLQNEILSEKDKFANISKELEQEVEKQRVEVMHLAELEKQLQELLLKKDNELVETVKESQRTISQTSQRMKKIEEELKEVKKEYMEQVLLLKKEIESEKEKFDAANKDFEEKLSKSSTENQSLQSAYEKSLLEKEIELREVVDISNTLQLKLEQRDLQVKELESELFHSKQQIEILSKDKTEGQSLLQKQLTEMRSKTEAELKVKDDKVQALQNEVKVLSQLEENRNKQISEINDLNSRLSNEVEENKEKFAEASLKLIQSQQEFQTLKDDCSVRNSAYEKEIETEKERFNSMKSELVQKWSELDALNAEMGKNLESKEMVIKNYKESTESLQNSEKKHTLQIDELESQLNNLKQQFEISNQDKSEAQISLQNQLNDLINKKETEEKLKDNTIEELKQQFAELSETMSSDMKEKESELILLRNALQEKEQQCVKFSETINSAEKEYLHLKQQNDSNLSLLESKESHIEELTCEQEKVLLQKEKTIEQLTSDLAQLSESNESKSSEMGGKDLEIVQLRSIVQEKESQFDHLSEMITSSQAQLVQLKQKLDSNLALLQSKEKYIEEFRSDQDKLLLQKEQLFKDEVSTLKSSLTDKEASLIQLEATLLSMEANAKQCKERIKCLEEEIEKSKQDNCKLLQDSGSVYTDLNAKVSSLESKYNALLEEKEKMVKLAKEELSTRDAKNGLEQVRDSLLKEKAEQQDIVKDREAKLEKLQVEVSRMSEQFLQHKQDLQQKLDVSNTELQATLELKNQLEIQHGVLEELQQNLQNSEDERKNLEIKCQSISTISAEKDELRKQLEKLVKSIMEKDNRISEVENQASELTNMLGKSQHLLHQKEAEFENANKQLRSAQVEISDIDKLKVKIKNLDDEKLSLKNKIRNLEELQTESRTTKNSNVANAEKDASEDEDKEFLRSQVDFLNSIIVEMKQKNEELGNQLELQSTCWEEADINLNTKKQLAPRLFCDICDVFDQHDTDDCPKQESMLEEDSPPPVKVKSSKTVKERPYCNNCEVFGHWTLDCDEQDTF